MAITRVQLFSLLTKAGVAFDSGIESAPWGRYAQFSDPDGNGLILQRTAM